MSLTAIECCANHQSPCMWNFTCIFHLINRTQLLAQKLYITIIVSNVTNGHGTFSNNAKLFKYGSTGEFLGESLANWLFSSGNANELGDASGMELTFFFAYYWFGWTNTFWFTLTTTGICGFTIEKAFNVVILPVFGFLTPLQELIWRVQLESRILLDFIPNDKHFPHMKQCNTAEMYWSPEIFILSEKSLFSLISLYFGTCCCLCHLTIFCRKSINRSSWVQSQPLSSLYKISLGCSSS